MKKCKFNVEKNEKEKGKEQPTRGKEKGIDFTPELELERERGLNGTQARE